MSKLQQLIIIILAGLFPMVCQAQTAKTTADEHPVVQHTIWNGCEMDKFMLADHACQVVKPHDFAPGKPWIWRPEFFGAYDQADQSLLKKGFTLAFMHFGSPLAMKLMDTFYDYTGNLKTPDSSRE